jgi:hypothetical protein
MFLLRAGVLGNAAEIQLWSRTYRLRRNRIKAAHPARFLSPGFLLLSALHLSGVEKGGLGGPGVV